MPTQTFFRLPEEKRERLIEAAWREFSEAPFADVSINRIIREAQIPRGSFYQYFGGKEDLFFHLLNTLREDFFALIETAMARGGGDPFRGTLAMFELVFQGSGQVLPSLERAVAVLRRNENMDVLNMLTEKMRADPQLLEIASKINWGLLRRTDDAYVQDVTVLLGFSLVCAAREILSDGADYAQEHETLKNRLEIIRCGSGKGETA
ncbi:MAG: TetR/AcrR family transcriptional regulator [Oscillibacter sp.]|nr:TetR/AcrR family transcriptional regulator [Oscillibacter sp.]